jgi:hypothetical protein
LNGNLHPKYQMPADKTGTSANSLDSWFQMIDECWLERIIGKISRKSSPNISQSGAGMSIILENIIDLAFRRKKTPSCGGKFQPLKAKLIQLSTGNW